MRKDQTGQMAIGGAVREMRARRGWTLADLGRRLDLSPSRLSQIERGEGSFSAEHLLTMLRLFNVGPEAFLPDAGAADAVEGSLHNALARLGASHLAVDEAALVRAEHGRLDDVIVDVLVRRPSPRLVTALPAVLVAHASEVPFASVQRAVAVAGAPHRWAWLLEHAQAAISASVGDGAPVRARRAARRVAAAAAEFVARLSVPSEAEPFDLLDLNLRSTSSIRAAEAAAGPVDRRWRVLSGLCETDFVAAMSAAHDGV